jgi:prepilin-type N-terminal cleavage/methylation domain-containing protein/prepilin-type processing-associated H-X9-DG protein
MHRPNNQPSVTLKYQPAGSRRAFTLVELLTVIAIVGVLAGILIPVGLSVRARARAAQCSSNMRQIAISLISYANDHKGQTVVAHYPDTGYNWAQEVTNWDGSIKTLKEGTSFGIWRCPENDDQTKSPMANGSGVANTSYMINGYKNSQETTGNRYGHNNTLVFRNPSKLYMVLEGRYFRCETNSQSGSQTIPDNIYPTSGSLNYARYPHDGSMHIAFADGHVSQVRGPVLDRGSSGSSSGANGFSNGDAWYAY